jgi:hypothetical protein
LAELLQLPLSNRGQEWHSQLNRPHIIEILSELRELLIGQSPMSLERDLVSIPDIHAPAFPSKHLLYVRGAEILGGELSEDPPSRVAINTSSTNVV